MTARIADLGDILAHTFTTPAPTAAVDDDPELHRWAPNADRATLTALLADIQAMPPVGPLLDDLARAVARCREVR